MTAHVGPEVETLTIRITIRLQRRGGRKLAPEGATIPIRKPAPDETLVKALVRAHRWRRRIESGRAKPITDLRNREGVAMPTLRLPPPAARLPRASTGDRRQGMNLLICCAGCP